MIRTPETIIRVFCNCFQWTLTQWKRNHRQSIIAVDVLENVLSKVSLIRRQKKCWSDGAVLSSVKSNLTGAAIKEGCSCLGARFVSTYLKMNIIYKENRKCCYLSQLYYW